MRYDATGVDASGGFPVIEHKGWLPFRIIVATEGKSKSGDYQVTVDCACLDARFKDYMVRHWVTFLPKDSKGAGMAIHFLKTIGEPYEGVLDIEPIRWERKLFIGKVEVSEYQGKKNNKFTEIAPYKDTAPSDEFGPLPPEPAEKTAFDE
jgi:hypothetical protein